MFIVYAFLTLSQVVLFRCLRQLRAQSPHILASQHDKEVRVLLSILHESVSAAAQQQQQGVASRTPAHTLATS